MSRANLFRRCVLRAFLLALIAGDSFAATITWIGGNANWDSSTANWSPADEPDSNDVALFNKPDLVTMTIDQTLQGLTLFGGASLSTGTRFVQVNGTIDLDEPNTSLTVHTNALLGGAPPVVSVNADDLIVTDGAEFFMANDVTIHDTSTTGGSDADTFGVVTIGAGSALRGNGRLLLNNSVSTPVVLFQNNGTIEALSYGNLSFVTSATLTLDAPDPEARIDLDGLSGSSIVNVTREQTLDMNIQQTDDFDGTINLFHNSTLDFQHDWQLNGVMNVNTGFIPGTPPLIPDIAAGIAIVTGGTVTMSESDSRINVIHDDGTLQFDAPLIATDGVIDNNGHLIFNAPATIGSGVDFLMEFDADLTVNDVVTVNDANWDWDDNGGSNNDITINSGGVLNANITAVGASVFNGDMHIVGGTLNVQGDGNDWEQFGGNITFEGTALSRIEGDKYILSSGTMRSLAGTNADIASATKWDGGTLDVDGELELVGSVEWAGTTVTGDGILEQEGNAIVSADTTIAVATFDWDQSTTTVNPGVTFTIDVDNIDRTDDTFNGNSITVNGSILVVTVADGSWTLGNAGTLNLTSPDASLAVVSGLGSDLVVASGGVINASAADARIAVPLTMQEGSEIRLSGTSPKFRGVSMVLAGGDVIDPSGNGTFEPIGLTVTGNSSINAETFIWDQAATTVEPGGILDVDVHDLGPGNSVDAVSITMNSGDIDVNTASLWQMNGNLRMNNTNNNPPVLSGSGVAVGGDVDIGGSGESEISASVSFVGTPTVDVAAGAKLHFTGDLVLLGEVNFTGEGTVSLDAATTSVINGSNNFTVNMPGGVFDLDGDSILGDEELQIRVPMTLNVAGIDENGLNEFDGDTIDISPTGSLTVNLPGIAGWVMSGLLELHGKDDGTFAAQLAGDTVELRDIVNVYDQSQIDARVNMRGAVNIAAGGTLLLLGGTSNSINPNRIEGGTINGPGLLSADNSKRLVGFGTINADIDFDGPNPSLLADDSELSVNGDILDIGVIGTADDDGILNVTHPWNTANTSGVELDGGELRGGKMTVDNSPFSRVSGHGLITAPVNNQGTIEASGGLLTLNAHVSSDYDGTTNSGSLRASLGDFTLQGGTTSSTVLFHGTIQASTNRTFTLDDMELRFQVDSTLTLNGGTLRSNGIVEFGGTVNVTGVATIAQFNSSFLYEITDTAIVNLNGDLQLQSLTNIQTGASFSGTGTLVNMSTLDLEDGADVDAHLDNQSSLRLIDQSVSPSVPSHASVDSVDTSGSLLVFLAGTGPDDYSRLSVDATATLSGEVWPILSDEFNPQLDDIFTILTASSVVGTFDTVSDELAPLDAGLGWQLFYNPTGVQLQVVSTNALTADVDMDGDVDGNDFLLIQRTNPALISDWQAQYGLSTEELQATGTAVPEPAPLTLLLAALTWAAQRRRL